MRKWFRVFAFALLIVALVVLVASVCFGGGGDDSEKLDPAAYPYDVQQPEVIEDRSHFDVGVTYDGYTSDPPTSGPHAAIWADPGINDTAVPREMLVHSMEHGMAIVWYNCNADPALSQDECTTLRNNLSQVVQEQIGSGREVVMSPYPAMDGRIALTGWGYLDTFPEFDAERVRTFIQTFECNFDPEGFC